MMGVWTLLTCLETIENSVFRWAQLRLPGVREAGTSVTIQLSACCLKHVTQIEAQCMSCSNLQVFPWRLRQSQHFGRRKYEADFPIVFWHSIHSIQSLGFKVLISIWFRQGMGLVRKVMHRTSGEVRTLELAEPAQHLSIVQSPVIWWLYGAIHGYTIPVISCILSKILGIITIHYRESHEPASRDDPGFWTRLMWLTTRSAVFGVSSSCSSLCVCHDVSGLCFESGWQEASSCPSLDVSLHCCWQIASCSGYASFEN